MMTQKAKRKGHVALSARLIAPILALAILACPARAVRATDAPSVIPANAGIQDSKDAQILRLRKALAESLMDNLQLRYERARREWKDILKQLGEPDPDAQKQDQKEGGK